MRFHFRPVIICFLRRAAKPNWDPHAGVRLVDHLDRPLIVLVPARDVVDPDTIEYLRGHQARLLFLQEVLTM